MFEPSRLRKMRGEFFVHRETKDRLDFIGNFGVKKPPLSGVNAKILMHIKDGTIPGKIYSHR